MSRKWKPGDVALYEYPASEPRIALRVKGGNSAVGGDCPIDYHPVDDHWHLSNDGWTSGDAGGIRGPLAVIDPEDREQVARLGKAIFDNGFRAVGRLSDALREYADPKPPKPEEPTGLGAVVEVEPMTIDDDGCTTTILIRHGDGLWWAAGDGGWCWSDIDVVRVLSEGVTE